MPPQWSWQLDRLYSNNRTNIPSFKMHSSKTTSLGMASLKKDSNDSTNGVSSHETLHVFYPLSNQATTSATSIQFRKKTRHARGKLSPKSEQFGEFEARKAENERQKSSKIKALHPITFEWQNECHELNESKKVVLQGCMCISHK